MIVSEARREANKRNASRSTGPRTEAGKARVRANSVKHGMTANTVVDDAEAFATRSAEWHARLKPVDATQGWFAGEIARITLKLDQSGEVERALRDNAALRAEVCWDGDRRVEVESLTRRISDRPGEVVARLEQSVQGCEWLIERWMMLADVANHRLFWDDDQVRLAYDLMGTPDAVRGANPCVRLDAEGERLANPDGEAGFARVEVERLRVLRDDLVALDDFDRTLTLAGLSDAASADLRRFRRYETSLQNRLKWCLKQFEPATGTSPRVAQAPSFSRFKEETPKDENPADDGIDASPLLDQPMTLPSRVDRKLDRAASRREAKERKRERRLA